MKTCIGILLAAMSVVVATEPPAPRRPLGVPGDAVAFKGRWYRVYLEAGGWKHSASRCTGLGGRLAMVPNAETHEFLKQLVPNKTVALWLGATDEKTEGLWLWSDGTPLIFTAWSGIDPGGGRQENYLLFRQGGWEDFPEKTKFAAGFICEWFK